jgi:hypothetical protein
LTTATEATARSHPSFAMTAISARLMPALEEIAFTLRLSAMTPTHAPLIIAYRAIACFSRHAFSMTEIHAPLINAFPEPAFILR